MAVVQRFTFGLPIDCVALPSRPPLPERGDVEVTMDRQTLVALHNDIGMALYPGDTGSLLAPPQAVWDDDEQPDTSHMTPEEYLAGLQVQQAQAQTPNPYRPGGSSIGTRNAE